MSGEPMASVFSVASLREWAGGEEDVVTELITIFLRIGPPMVLRLQAALAAGDSVATAQEAHDLKGCLILLGATQASADCARIERQARREGSCPAPADAGTFCASLVDIVQQVRTYAAAHPAIL